MRKLLVVPAIRGLFIFLLVACTLLGLTAKPEASSSTILAVDYPYSTLFFAMAQRGITDFAGMNRSIPATLAQIAADGYMSYQLPTQCELQYVPEGDHSTLGSLGRVLFEGPNQLQAVDVTVSIPPQEPYRLKQEALPKQGPDGTLTWEETTVKVYSWHGAEWLDKGLGMGEIRQALVYDRLQSHLAFAAAEFLKFNDGANPPQDLLELEQFMGVERNPIAWQRVQVVNGLQEVGYAQGNLYVGYDGDNWVVTCNLGPEIKQATFINSGGYWNMSLGTNITY